MPRRKLRKEESKRKTRFPGEARLAKGPKEPGTLLSSPGAATEPPAEGIAQGPGNRARSFVPTVRQLWKQPPSHPGSSTAQRPHGNQDSAAGPGRAGGVMRASGAQIFSTDPAPGNSHTGATGPIEPAQKPSTLESREDGSAWSANPSA